MTIFLFSLLAYLGWQVHPTTPSFVLIETKFPELFAQGGPQIMMISISVTLVSSLIGMSHSAQL
jgi:hypothetical protein